MNYTALQAAVASYLHRADATTDTNIANFIEFARLRIGRDVRALANLTTSTLSTWVDNEASLPAALTKLRTVSIDGVALTSAATEDLTWQFSNTYAVRGQGTSAPKIHIPNIANGTDVLIEYWANPTALSAGSDVSYGMAEWPQVWIQASVIEAAFWQRDWDTYNQLLPLYQAEVSALNSQCQEALYGNAPAIMSDQPMIQASGWL